MNCKFINVLVFAAGAAIGSAVTWKVLRTRYERITQEEIESVKEAFADRYSAVEKQDDQKECDGQINWDELEDLDEEEEDDPDAAELREYTSIANSYGKVNDDTNKKGGAEDVNNTEYDTPVAPYVISPYDFGEIDEYSNVELTYYADGTLEDEGGNIITDVDNLIGPKALTTFGEYEDDAVFVRNEYLEADFQILKDPRTYKEARSIGPDVVDDE